MPDSSLALAESLLLEPVPRSARCGAKFVKAFALFLGLGFAVFLSLGGGQHLAVQQFSSNLLAIPVASSRGQSLPFTSAAWARNSPFSVQGRSQRVPNVKVSGISGKTTELEGALQAAPSHARRAALLSGAALLSTFGANQAKAASVTACKPGANNCWSTLSTDKCKMMPWTWPASSSREKAIGELKSVLQSYPQEGQNEVDRGGWSIAVDELADKGYMRLEYKSGLGTFAKLFNGNKPFIDDLEVSVEPSFVAVRSSSRVGDSDLGVNAKRLNWLTAALSAKGWTAPQVGM